MKPYTPEEMEARLQTVLDGVKAGWSFAVIGHHLNVSKKTVGNMISDARRRGDMRFITLEYTTAPGPLQSDPLSPEELALARDAGNSMTRIARRLRVDYRRIARMEERLRGERHPLFLEPWPPHARQITKGPKAPRKRVKKPAAPRSDRPASKPVTDYTRVIGDVPITVCPPGYAAGGVTFLGGWPEKPGQPPSEAAPRTMEVPQHLHRATTNPWTGKYNHRGSRAAGRTVADKVLG